MKSRADNGIGCGLSATPVLFYAGGGCKVGPCRFSYTQSTNCSGEFPNLRHRGSHACAPSGCIGRAPPIFSKGDPANALFIVKAGRVRILYLSDKGTETIVHILKEGAIFGELLLSEEQRAFTAIASTDAMVTVLSKEVWWNSWRHPHRIEEFHPTALEEIGECGEGIRGVRAHVVLPPPREGPAPAVRRAWPGIPEGDRDPLAPDARRPGEPDRDHPGDGHDPDEPVPAHGAREAPGPLPHRQQASTPGVRPLLTLGDAATEHAPRRSPVPVPIADSCRGSGRISLEHILAAVPTHVLHSFFRSNRIGPKYGMIRLAFNLKNSFCASFHKRPPPSLVSYGQKERR